MIGSLLQVELEEIIKDKNWDELRQIVSEMDPPDIAEVLIDVPPEDPRDAPGGGRVGRHGQPRR